MNPKRRWLLLALPIVVVAGVVGFIVFRDEPKDDPPRLVVLQQQQKDGQQVVVFRLDAPKHRAVSIGRITTQDLATGKESSPSGVFDLTCRYEVFDFIRAGMLGQWITAEARQAKEFSVVTPPDQKWRLRCGVAVRDPRMRELQKRLLLSWRTKSLRTLLRGRIYISWEPLDSDPITNAIPPNADAPRP